MKKPATRKKARGFKPSPCVTIPKQTAAKLHAATSAENTCIKRTLVANKSLIESLTASVQCAADGMATMVQALKDVIAIVDSFQRQAGCVSGWLILTETQKKKLEDARALTVF